MIKLTKLLASKLHRIQNSISFMVPLFSRVQEAI